MNSGLVSVIIPYNKDRGFLSEAIASVRMQTYKSWELIEAYSDQSCAGNINMGLLRAGGEFVKILAEDDVLLPRCLEILVAGIRGYDFVYADGENFGDIRNYPPRSKDKTTTFESMLEKNGINGGAVLYRTKILKEVGGWNKKLHTAEEYDLHLRLIKAGYKHRHIDAVVYRYRVHAENKSRMDTSFKRLSRHAYIDDIRNQYR